MSTPRERFWNNITGILAPLILGAGFVALFAGFNYFFLIWILGFAVVLPIVAILFDEDENEWDPFENQSRDSSIENETRTDSNTESESTQQGTFDEESTTDALSTLRERYANGNLTDEQFEKKLDRLLETETPENAAKWRERTTRDFETEETR